MFFPPRLHCHTAWGHLSNKEKGKTAENKHKLPN